MAEAFGIACLGKLGGTALEKIGGCLAAPIGRQYHYLFCFKSNIENLETQLEKLETTRLGVQMGVDEDTRSVRIIDPNVEAWLTKVNEIKVEAEEITIQSKAEVQTGCLKGWCSNLKLRYSLSRKAMMKTQVIVDLQADGIKYTRLSYGPLPACMETIPYDEFHWFDSRVLSMEEILKAVADDEVNLIGICGMGGIGKTTMVKEVQKRAKEEELFDEVAMVVVSQEPNLIKIQGCIADMLGLKLDDKESLIARASLLSKRLLQDKKKILLILDDIWEELDLKDIGIPFRGGSKHFKILYTSRTQGLWHDARNKKEIPLGLLSKEESWKLFKEKVGDLTHAPDLLPIAKQIMDECGCLPLALVTIGGTLSKKSRGNFIKHKWEDMLNRLNCSSGTPADKRLYSSLQLSYTCLEDEEAKRLFLLCCLFKEDYDILIEDLVRYGMGLSPFRGVDEIAQVRHRVFALVDDLKSRYLLLEGKGDQYVKVHDVVRDVGISIVSGDKHGCIIRHGGKSREWPKKATYEHCTFISMVSSKISELPEGLRCPSLEFLLLECKNLEEVPFNFFEGMGELKVLRLKSKAIPSLQFLRNLQTLSLSACSYNLRNIPGIGELLNLEILTLSKFEELPEEIGRLTNLRLLDVTQCYPLHRIPQGLISRLVLLEELYMSEFLNWEREGNASLREFESLLNLNTLEIRIIDAVLLPRVPPFSRLRRYRIEICDSGNLGRQFQRQLMVNLQTRIPLDPLECGIYLLLNSAESLHLLKDGCSDLVHELLQDGAEGLQNLKDLVIAECDTPECLTNTTDTTAPAVFPILESLHLYNLPNLREICHGQVPGGSFGRLTSLHIHGCGKLGNFFRLSTPRCLLQLERLSIESCGIMEEVISEESGEDVYVATNKIVFPKLKYLKLEGLPNLIGFCKGLYEIEFPQLRAMSHGNLPRINCLFLIKSDLSSDSEENHNAALFCVSHQQVAFPNLEVLELPVDLENPEGLEWNPLSAWALSNLRRVNVNYRDNAYPSQVLSRLRNLDRSGPPEHLFSRTFG